VIAIILLWHIIERMKILNSIRSKYKTQKAMAESLSYAPSLISDWFSGNKSVSPEAINRIAKKHRIRPGKLFEDCYPTDD
jgi:DNA-binding transcriptional regulator YdaS (Cro superfamily)